MSVDASHQKIKAVLTFCVFASGGIALVLEQVYEKLLSTLIGSSVPAATIVLMTYFAGIAIGSLLAPTGSKHARVRLALLELFVVIWGVVVIFGFAPSYDYFVTLLKLYDDSAFGLVMVRLLIAAFWILPPTIAIGANFPVLMAVLKSLGWQRSEEMTFFYYMNLLGAFVFTMVAPYLLFYHFGLQYTLYISCALGVLVAALILLYVPEGKEEKAIKRTKEKPIALDKGLLTIAFASGFLLFVMEVLWFHLIVTGISNSVYSFAIMLGVVLVSLALGTRAVLQNPPANALEGKQQLLNTLMWLVLALPLAAMVYPYMGHVATLFAAFYRAFWFGEVVKFLVVLAVILPVSFLLATLFPMVFQTINKQTVAPSPRQVGVFIAINTFGAVLGALVGGFVLIPTIGAEAALKVIWVLVALVFGYLFLQNKTLFEEAKHPVGALVIGLAMVLFLPKWDKLQLTSGNGVYLTVQYATEDPTELVFFHEDNYAGYVTVKKLAEYNEILDKPYSLRLDNNGKFDASDGNEVVAQSAASMLGALFAKEKEHAFVIGVGSGQTASVPWALGFDTVEVAEISPGHVIAAREHFAHINLDVLKQDNVTVHVDDARNSLLRTDKQYDLIACEITSIWFAGASNLYSKEFYELMKTRLKKGGVFQQWVQIHHLSPKEIMVVLGTLQDSFNYVSYWYAGNQSFILASDEPFRVNPDIAAQIMTEPQLGLVRRASEVHTVDDILAWQLLDVDELKAMLKKQEYVVNTDKNRWIEYHTPRYYMDRKDWRAHNLEFIRSYQR
jgi:spermidine synthase